MFLLYDAKGRRPNGAWLTVLRMYMSKKNSPLCSHSPAVTFVVDGIPPWPAPTVWNPPITMVTQHHPAPSVDPTCQFMSEQILISTGYCLSRLFTRTRANTHKKSLPSYLAASLKHRNNAWLCVYNLPPQIENQQVLCKDKWRCRWSM